MKREQIREQIRELILSPNWPHLSLKAKQRWLDQYQQYLTVPQDAEEHSFPANDTLPDEEP